MKEISHKRSLIVQVHLWNIQKRQIHGDESRWVVTRGEGVCVSLVPQPCPTLCNPMDCSSSLHEILQARILEWVAMPSSRVSSQPRDRTQVSSTASGFFTIWAPREALKDNRCSSYVVFGGVASLPDDRPSSPLCLVLMLLPCLGLLPGTK